MKTPDYLAEAKESLDIAGDVLSESEEITTPTEALLGAQALSIYALAEEQRTANLIAWCSQSASSSLRYEIQKRLGL